MNAISASSGAATIAGPSTSPRPVSRCRAPVGTPARHSTSHSAAAHSPACSAGFSTTLLPIISAAAAMPQGMATGKFHGAITAATPRPVQRVRVRSPGRVQPSPAARRSPCRA